MTRFCSLLWADRPTTGLATPEPIRDQLILKKRRSRKMISFSITLEETTVNPPLAGRSRDWWSQAVRDLKFAEESINGEWHEWACFAAHQAAEMAVKALYFHLSRRPDGSLVSRLLKGLPDTIGVDEDFVESAKVLDTFYIPTLYPDSHAEGAPFEHYGPLQSQGAIACATRILEFVQRSVDSGGVTNRRTRRRK